LNIFSGRQHAYAARSDILPVNYWENKHCEKVYFAIKSESLDLSDSKNGGIRETDRLTTKKCWNYHQKLMMSAE